MIEHPNRTSQQFKLVDTDKPIEDTPEVFRFQIALKAGEARTFPVKEEQELSSTLTLTNSQEDQFRHFISLTEASASLKQKLKEALALKGAWDGLARDGSQCMVDLTRLNADQDRIRKNLRETPKEAEVYQTYLKKLSDQEKEIDALTARQMQLLTEEFAARKKYEDYLANLSD